MHVFDAAQPALLYLVPFCLGTSFFTAVARGELTELLRYDSDGTKPPAAAGADAKKSPATESKKAK